MSGSARLLVDTPDGLLTAAGEVFDLSEGGCAIRLHRRVDAYVAGRAHVTVSGKELWLPVITRWARPDAGGWLVGCQFDRLTEEKTRVIRSLVSNRQRLAV